MVAFYSNTNPIYEIFGAYFYNFGISRSSTFRHPWDKDPEDLQLP